jgi:hypothetical protein
MAMEEVRVGIRFRQRKDTVQLPLEVEPFPMVGRAGSGLVVGERADVAGLGITGSGIGIG